MRAFFVLWRRELGAFFLSPVAYVTLAFFLLAMGGSFWLLADVLVDGAPGATVMGELFGSIFFWIAVLVTVPLLTMRLFAEEKRSGTFETLMTAPVGDLAVVLAKYAAACTLYAALWLPTLLHVFILRSFSTGGAPLDPGVVGAGYLGAMLVGAMFLSVGLLASALTRNQIVAAVVSFASLCLLFLAGFLPYLSRNEAVQAAGRYASVVVHMLDFSRGTVDSRALVFFSVNTAWMLAAAVKAVEARQWK